jgi:type II secretory pathway pseudopilin PulG
VVTIFTILLDPNDTATKNTVILSSLVVTLLGALFFIRIINPLKLQRFTRHFPLAVVAIVGLALIFAAAGPFRNEIGARQDKLIENNLETVNSAISTYARTNKRLPENLGQLDVSNDAKKLAQSNVIEYRQTTSAPTSPILNSLKNTPTYTSYTNTQATYELCVTYKKAKNDDSNYHTNDSTYLSTYSHKAGRQCYNQTVYFENYGNVTPLNR